MSKKNIFSIYAVLSIFLTFIIAFLSLDYLYPLSLGRTKEVSTVISTSDNPFGHVFLSKDEKWRIQTTLEEVDPRFIDYLIYCEDKHYWHHGGVNPLSLLRALWQWSYHKQIVSGGSTLTMQTARLLEPRPRRVSSKIIEIFRALQLEFHFSKQEILNIYLTLAPYGGNIEGIQAASQMYFSKPAKILNSAEIALLIALPQSPRRYFNHSFTPKALTARNSLLKRLLQGGYLDEFTFRAAQAETLPARKALPHYLPHLALRLKNQSPAKALLKTSIILSLQKHIQTLSQRTIEHLPSHTNIAVMVVHHPTQEVVAYVGSADFFSFHNKGQIDYTRALRSPGSTLKPFIYGMGFEEGLFQPNSLVADEAKYYGSYRPGNFDKTFNGFVTIEDALIHSLNIPAVSALKNIGPLKFLGLLEEVNIKPTFPDPYTAPGLALALGGVGMTLEQLVILYSSLATEGIIYPLKYQPGPRTEGRRLFSAQTCALLTKILQKTSAAHRNDITPTSIAFKTGTSYGHRDAWVVGYDEHYVVGIWIGQPNGNSMGQGTGSTLAVPLLQQIFQILPVRAYSSTSCPVPALCPLVQSEFSLRKNQKVAFSNGENKNYPLKLLFPIHDSKFDIFASKNKNIVLKGTGGKRPYIWLINNSLLVSKYWRPHYMWTPPQPGFYKITLIDAEGQSESASIKVD